VSLSSQVLEFEGKARGSLLGKILVLPAIVRLDWKVFSRCKHSSVFGLIISNEEKKFYNVGPWWHLIELIAT
jgi:hypothetical protein